MKKLAWNEISPTSLRYIMTLFLALSKVAAKRHHHAAHSLFLGNHHAFNAFLAKPLGRNFADSGGQDRSAECLKHSLQLVVGTCIIRKKTELGRACKATASTLPPTISSTSCETSSSSGGMCLYGRICSTTAPRLSSHSTSLGADSPCSCRMTRLPDKSCGASDRISPDVLPSSSRTTGARPRFSAHLPFCTLLPQSRCAAAFHSMYPKGPSVRPYHKWLPGRFRRKYRPRCRRFEPSFDRTAQYLIIQKYGSLGRTKQRGSSHLLHQLSHVCRLARTSQSDDPIFHMLCHVICPTLIISSLWIR